MIKKNTRFTILSLALIFVMAFPNLGFANAIPSNSATGSTVGVKVNIRIEGYNGNLAKGSVYAYTFMDALKMISTDHNLEIQILPNATGDIVFSIGGIENGYFKGRDAWMAYIERNGEMITSSTILSTALVADDSLVVYYGEFAKTNILSVFDIISDDTNINIYAGIKNADWVMSGGTWVLDAGMKPAEGIRINVMLPNGNAKVLKTNAEGIAKTTFTGAGVYKYYAEDYNTAAVPKIAPTSERYYVYGIENPKKLTRAEALAFIMNTFPIKNFNIDITFSDVERSHKYYDEIKLAVEAGVISGFDGNFMPDEPITMLQMAIMLSNAANYKFIVQKQYDVPDWALASVNIVMQSTLFNQVNVDWPGPVTGDDLIQIYKNYKNIS